MGVGVTTFEQRAKWSVVALLAPTAVCLLATIVITRVLQDEQYHVFADQRTLLGIPNFWNVVSNLPFAAVGILGLLKLRDVYSRVLFAGIFLVAAGSAYYHLAPDTARLLWDRLPMTIAFMSLVAIVVGERIWWLAGFLICGVGSIVWWRATGNLVPYGIVQFGPIAIIVAMLIAGRHRALWPVVVLYGIAKLAEFEDAQIYDSFPLSGHTLKHLAAAAATWFVYRWR